MHEWQSFLSELEKELGKETIERWATTLHPKSNDRKKLIIEAQDSFQALWFEEHIRNRLATFLQNRGIFSKVILETRGQKKKTALKLKEAPRDPSFSLSFHELDPSFTFDQFVPSDENELVMKVLDEVSSFLISQKMKSFSTVTQEKPFKQPPPNPIYLYGPTGSGKSHLLTACAHRLERSGLNVIMARTDLFTDHVIRSIRAGEMTSFRSLWRGADVLIVDDIHLLAKKNVTQEEFFHTFNSLHVAGKQIILSASCLPQQLQFIEPRLVSRFEWGIVLPLQVFPKKKILTLLEKKASFFKFPLTNRVAQFLHEVFQSSPKSSIRALEALVLRLHLARGKDKKDSSSLSLQNLNELLADLIEDEKKLALTPEKIISITAESYGIKSEDILGKSQSRECVLPRQLSMFLIRKHLKTPFMKIGDLFQRDHSTVMSAIRQIEKLIPSSSSDVGSTIASIEVRLHEISR